jgi:hypothetical protein
MDELASLKETERQQIREQLVAFYEEHNPDKLKNVDRMLELATQKEIAKAVFEEYGDLPEGWKPPVKTSHFLSGMILGLVCATLILCVVMTVSHEMQRQPQVMQGRLPLIELEKSTISKPPVAPKPGGNLPKQKQRKVPPVPPAEPKAPAKSKPALPFPPVGDGTTVFKKGQWSNPPNGAPLVMVKGEKLKIMIKQYDQDRGMRLKSFEGTPGLLIAQKSIAVQLDAEVRKQFYLCSK